MSRYGHRRIGRRDLLKAAGALAAALAALGGGAHLLQRLDDKENAASAASYTTNDHRAEAELKEITYNGRTYRQRPDLETYLLMGVDTSGEGLGVNSYAGGGQADVQMVVVLDNANRTWQMLQLNRDSIVQVPVRGVQGDIIAYENEQLALAYYYGDGREASCENTVLTVSMLLDGQTIDGYAAVNMDAVGIITDMVGGVTLTVTSDFSAIDPTLVEGETITLYGDQALTYVRSRYNIDDETNLGPHGPAAAVSGGPGRKTAPAGRGFRGLGLPGTVGRYGHQHRQRHRGGHRGPPAGIYRTAAAHHRRRKRGGGGALGLPPG